MKPKKGFANVMPMFQWGDNKTTKVYKVSEELHGRLYHSLQQMKLAYKRKNNMKMLSQKVQSIHDKLMLQKSKEEKEERELCKKHEHVNVILPCYAIYGNYRNVPMLIKT